MVNKAVQKSRESRESGLNALGPCPCRQDTEVWEVSPGMLMALLMRQLWKVPARKGGGEELVGHVHYVWQHLLAGGSASVPHSGAASKDARCGTLEEAHDGGWSRGLWAFLASEVVLSVQERSSVMYSSGTWCCTPPQLLARKEHQANIMRAFTCFLRPCLCTDLLALQGCQSSWWAGWGEEWFSWGWCKEISFLELTPVQQWVQA